MVVPNDVIDHLNGIDGVLRVIIMDSDFSEVIHREELNTKSATGMDVINRSYDEVMEKENKLALIVDNRVFDSKMKDYATVLMVNSKGDVVGRSLKPEEMDGYRTREDIVWVSKDFIVLVDSAFDGAERFIIPATHTTLLDSIPHCAGAIVAHPCTTSDMMIKSKAGFDLSKEASTIVIGFDND